MKTIAKKAPMEQRKPDLFENASGVELKLHEAKRRDVEQNKVPLRIDQRTVIMVRPDKCTKDYAQKIRLKFQAV
jgi:hypothetical protein